MPTPHKDRKTSSKEPVPIPERIRKHFKSLVAQIDGGHLKNGIKTCDKILCLAPDDPDALQTKLALLLQTEQYFTALTLAESLASRPGRAFPPEFGKAYTLYRLNRESEASDVVTSVNSETEREQRGVMHLEAQIEYRRGNYERAHSLYSDIFDSSPPQSDEQNDSLTNLTAAQTHLDFLQTGFLQALHSLPASAIASLEEAPPPSLPSTHPVLTVSPDKQTATRQKKVRMSRVPKGVIPGVTPPPDPERWLKKSERTHVPYHGGKRRKGPSGGATQGSVVDNVPKVISKSKKRK